MAKTATLDPHPIIDHGTVEQYKTFIKAAITNVGGPENTELYWFMLELFTDHDSSKSGQVTLASFPAMMNELVNTAKKHELPIPAEVSCVCIVCVSTLGNLCRINMRPSSRSTTRGATAP